MLLNYNCPDSHILKWDLNIMGNGWWTCCSQCHYVECSSVYRA